ncbi:MAG: hypothetical protein HY726_08320 [Candidatus Rokubacteria bacterium]|nr:hypothetical protein [Candidatus Rokubacteria bacterium]
MPCERAFGWIEGLALLLMLALFLAPGELPGGRPANFDDLELDQRVAVAGRPSGAREVRAHEIGIQNGPGEEKLQGRIQLVNGVEKSLAVLGVKVVMTEETQIQDRLGQSRLSALRPGMAAEVRGKLREDEVFEAAKITVSNGKAGEGIEVTGRVQNIDKSDKTLNVMGLTIRVTPATKLKFD